MKTNNKRDVWKNFALGFLCCFCLLALINAATTSLTCSGRFQMQAISTNRYTVVFVNDSYTGEVNCVYKEDINSIPNVKNLGKPIIENGPAPLNY